MLPSSPVQRPMWLRTLALYTLWTILVLLPIAGGSLLLWKSGQSPDSTSLVLYFLAIVCFCLIAPFFLLGKWLTKGRLDDQDYEGCAEFMFQGCAEGCLLGLLPLLLGVLMVALPLIALL